MPKDPSEAKRDINSILEAIDETIRSDEFCSKGLEGVVREVGRGESWYILEIAKSICGCLRTREKDRAKRLGRERHTVYGTADLRLTRGF